jgi:hypothetical protein
VIFGGVVCGTWVRTGDDLAVTWLEGRRRPDAEIDRERGRLAHLLDRDLRLSVTS